MTPREALPKAKAAAIKALELDGALGEAHNSLAFCLDGFDWDFDAAGREFQRAIELNPGYATAHHWYAWHLALLHRYDEALVGNEKGGKPGSALARHQRRSGGAARPRAFVRRIDTTEPQGDRNGSRVLASRTIISARRTSRNTCIDEAIAELQKAVQLSGGSPTCIANLARAYAASGRRSEAEALLSDLKKRSSPAIRMARRSP